MPLKYIMSHDVYKKDTVVIYSVNVKKTFVHCIETKQDSITS